MQDKIIADEDVDFRIIKQLRQNRFNVHSILESNSGISDIEVINLSNQQNSILLTEDKDFGDLVFSYKYETFGIILLRYNYKDLNQIIKNLIFILKSKDFIFFKNKLVVITSKKIRIREI